MFLSVLFLYLFSLLFLVFFVVYVFFFVFVALSLFSLFFFVFIVFCVFLVYQLFLFFFVFYMVLFVFICFYLLFFICFVFLICFSLFSLFFLVFICFLCFSLFYFFCYIESNRSIILNCVFYLLFWFSVFLANRGNPPTHPIYLPQYLFMRTRKRPYGLTSALANIFIMHCEFYANYCCRFPFSR